MYDLIVTQAFGAYARGARITDDAEIASVLDSENEARVVRVAKEKSSPPALPPTEADEGAK